MLLPFLLLLVQWMAAAKFRYIHPSKSDQKDLAKVPPALRLFVDYHDAMKYGSALILVCCVGWLSLGVGLSASVDLIAKIGMLTSTLILAVALSWRMSLPVR
jgi:cobalamin biosynthesis protein CobD/CbiB